MTYILDACAVLALLNKELGKGCEIRFIRDISDEVYFETAHYKARYSMSLADAFLCATAQSLAAVIVTKDKEIKPAEKDGYLSVLWI